MIKWLASISPIAVLLIGAIPAAGVGWLAHGVKFDWIDRPHIIELATDRANDAATIRIMDAANRAEIAERDRQERVSAEARRIYDEALANSDRAALEAQTRMEQEIAAYEHELALEGRSRTVTQRDLDWVRGIGTPGGADSGR